MIKISVSLKDQHIIRMTVKGHAQSALKGEDLVCASVSSITTGALNALDILVHDACELSLTKGKDPIIDIMVKEGQNKDVQNILKAVLIQLKTLEETQGKYLHIQEVQL
jgi:hypothetical protein